MWCPLEDGIEDSMILRYAHAFSADDANRIRGEILEDQLSYRQILDRPEETRWFVFYADTVIELMGVIWFPCALFGALGRIGSRPQTMGERKDGKHEPDFSS
jgi:hypothetical protein